MATKEALGESKNRALEAVQRRFAAEAKVQHRPVREKRKRPEENPDSETDGLTYSRICRPVHENLLTVVDVTDQRKNMVDKFLHDLLRKGDSAQKYIQGSRSANVDYRINLDNFVQGNNTSVARMQALQANAKRSQKHMSMKQLKECGILDLPEELQKFELFVPLHEMWKEYVIQLLRNAGKNQVPALLFGADLHGAIIQVAECRIDSFVGVLGIMVRETAETFGLVTQDGKFRVVPKRNSVFVLQADCWRITLRGDKYVSRKLSS